MSHRGRPEGAVPSNKQRRKEVMFSCVEKVNQGVNALFRLSLISHFHYHLSRSSLLVDKKNAALQDV